MQTSNSNEGISDQICGLPSGHVGHRVSWSGCPRSRPAGHFRVPRFLKPKSSQSHPAKAHRAAGRKASSSAAIHGWQSAEPLSACRCSAFSLTILIGDSPLAPSPRASAARRTYVLNPSSHVAAQARGSHAILWRRRLRRRVDGMGGTAELTSNPYRTTIRSAAIEGADKARFTGS
jgi:hypothetical protein